MQSSVVILCCTVLAAVLQGGSTLALNSQMAGTAVSAFREFDQSRNAADARAPQTLALLGEIPDRVLFVLTHFNVPPNAVKGSKDKAFLRLAQVDSTGFRVNSVTGISGEMVPLNIILPADATSLGNHYTFLMFRGVPEAIGFSAGFRTGNNWIVSLGDIHRLAIRSTPSYQGRFSLEVLLYRGVGGVPFSQQMTVEIGSNIAKTNGFAAVPLGPVRQAGQSPPGPAIADLPAFPREAPRLPPQNTTSPGEEQVLMAKGWAFLSNGNIASARFIFEDLALKGSRAGAFALAQTFDPNFLKMVIVIGTKPANVEEAKKWYRIAAERGDDNAQERLIALERN